MSIIKAGGKWMTRALALKLGRSVIKKGGVLGIGAGVLVGVGYLANNFFKNRKKMNLKNIGDIQNNNPEVKGKKIVV